MVDNSEYIEVDGLRYRKNVAMIVFNKKGKVLFAERNQNSSIYSKKKTYNWQFPQGGIDVGEEPETAALRELFEETGISNAKIVYTDSVWRPYKFPAELMFISHPNHDYYKNVKGQIQKWFLIEYDGDDSDIAIPNEELKSYKWIELTPEIVSKVVPFKREVYTNIVNLMIPILKDVMNSFSICKKDCKD